MRDLIQAHILQLAESMLIIYDSTNGTTLTNGTSACPGQIITRAGLANLPNFNNVTGCNAISTTFGISSNELRVAIDDYFCAPSLPAYCLAAPCSVHLVSANETW